MTDIIDIDPVDFIKAQSGIDNLYIRFDDHLFKCLSEGRSKRLSLSLDEVTDFRHLLTAAQRVLSALEEDVGYPDPDGGGTRVVGNVIYPEAFHSEAA